VIDANEREICRNELVGRGLRREEVIGTPLARLTKTQEDGGGSPAGLAKNRGPTQ
jgi:hypothetical protein